MRARVCCGGTHSSGRVSSFIFLCFTSGNNLLPPRPHAAMSSCFRARQRRRGGGRSGDVSGSPAPRATPFMSSPLTSSYCSSSFAPLTQLPERI